MAMSMPTGGGSGMGGTPAVCTPADSPGNLTTAGLDMSNETVAHNFLLEILDDTCLQVWSNAYAMDFWYGIIVAIALFALANLSQWAKLNLR